VFVAFDDIKAVSISVITSPGLKLKMPTPLSAYSCANDLVKENTQALEAA